MRTYNSYKFEQIKNLELKKFVNSIRIQNPVAVTLTEKQHYEGQKLDDIVSSLNVHNFMNRMNKSLFGNSYKRYGNSLEAIFVREDAPDKRHHIHCELERPNRISPIGFNVLIRSCWQKTKFGYNHVWIDNNVDSGWREYLLKRRTKPDYCDAIDWENCNFDLPATLN